MIRNLIDIEKLSEDDEKIGSDKKQQESAKDENIAEDPVTEAIAEEEEVEKIEEKATEVKSDKSKEPEIKQIAAEEIFSQLDAKQEKIAEEMVLPEPDVEDEKPKTVKEILADDTFLKLEEAARQIETEAEIESKTKPGGATPAGEEFEIEDQKIKRLESELAKIEHELIAEKEAEEKLKAEKTTKEKRKTPVINSIFAEMEESSVLETKEPEGFSVTGDTKSSELVKSEEKPFQTDTRPETRVETFRKSGLAYSAAIVLLGAVVFMMIIGWGADLLLGTSPWGIVVGIVFGSILGFVQFFRVTSGIFKK